jgi:hypothetical protein
MSLGTIVWFRAGDASKARAWGYELIASAGTWSVAVVGGVIVASGQAGDLEAARQAAEAHCGTLLTPRKPVSPDCPPRVGLWMRR